MAFSFQTNELLNALELRRKELGVITDTIKKEIEDLDSQESDLRHELTQYNAELEGIAKIMHAHMALTGLLKLRETETAETPQIATRVW